MRSILRQRLQRLEAARASETGSACRWLHWDVMVLGPEDLPTTGKIFLPGKAPNAAQWAERWRHGLVPAEPLEDLEEL